MSAPVTELLDLSLVIPAYNEAASLPGLLTELRAALSHLDKTYEVIVVDDGSTDGTFQVLKQLAEADPCLIAVQLRRNFGQTAAFAAGFNLAQGEVIVTLDADGQNDPADILALLAKIDAGYDIASGWRVNRKEPFITRRIPSLIANWILARRSGVRLHDSGCSLKAYRREVVKHVRLYGEMHRFIPALASGMGVTAAEVPVNDRARQFGKSKYGLSRTFRVILDLFTLNFLLGFQARPMQLFGGLGLLTGGAGFLILLYLTYLKLTQNVLLSNRPILWLGVMLVIIGVQFMFFGLIAEMMTRIYHESTNTQTYTIRQIVHNQLTSQPANYPTDQLPTHPAHDLPRHEATQHRP
ncbi:MAG TPA: glycosyltransferase family 2 protein [Anaerolineae bacterium]|nr:glycosyltransferase family 2 protein [Anaerolineae bacterium]